MTHEQEIAFGQWLVDEVDSAHGKPTEAGLRLVLNKWSGFPPFDRDGAAAASPQAPQDVKCPTCNATMYTLPGTIHCPVCSPQAPAPPDEAAIFYDECEYCHATQQPHDAGCPKYVEPSASPAGLERIVQAVEMLRRTSQYLMQAAVKVGIEETLTILSRSLEGRGPIAPNGQSMFCGTCQKPYVLDGGVWPQCWRPTCEHKNPMVNPAPFVEGRGGVTPLSLTSEGDNNGKQAGRRSKITGGITPQTADQQISKPAHEGDAMSKVWTQGSDEEGPTAGGMADSEGVRLLQVREAERDGVEAHQPHDYWSEYNKAVGKLDALRRERNEANTIAGNALDEIRRLTAAVIENDKSAGAWMARAETAEARAAQLEAALRKLVDTAIVLGADYLSVFEQKKDDETVQGWDVGRWRRLLKAHDEAKAALAVPVAQDGTK